MRALDTFQLSIGAVAAQRMRSALTAVGIAIGIAAVVVLTAIGEGLHDFVLREFTQFGTNIIGINPGRTVTHGTPLGVLGSVRPLSLDDAASLRGISQVTAVVAGVSGNGEVEAGNRRRRVMVLGTGSAMPDVFVTQLASGQFLPDDGENSRSLAVLGSKLKAELFGAQNALGERIRVGGQKFVVIGVMAAKGETLGMNLDDIVFIPTARAMELFNRDGVMEINVSYPDGVNVEEVVRQIKRILIARHGSEDFTITTQQQMLDVLGSILGVLTLAVGALGGVSLVVGGIGVLAIMTIAVNERIGEIGLLRSLGASGGQIRWLFLSDAVWLAGAGGLAGMIVGVDSVVTAAWLVPGLPVKVSILYLALAEVIAVTVGLLAGMLPAFRAARLNPIDALRAE